MKHRSRWALVILGLLAGVVLSGALRPARAEEPSIYIHNATGSVTGTFSSTVPRARMILKDRAGADSLGPNLSDYVRVRWISIYATDTDSSAGQGSALNYTKGFVVRLNPDAATGGNVAFYFDRIAPPIQTNLYDVNGWANWGTLIAPPGGILLDNTSTWSVTVQPIRLAMASPAATITYYVTVGYELASRQSYQPQSWK